MPAHASPPPQPHPATTVCAYDATKTQRPNALGMRAYISIVSDGHDTIVIYHHFQEPLGFTDARAWMVTRKTLNFWSMKLADVRALLKRDPRYISELLADDDAHPDPSLYPKLDATLTCRKDGHSLMEILRSEGR